MTASAIELALRKQRLQLKSAELRARWAHYAAGVRPLCTGVDGARAAAVWVRRHPEVPVAAAVALAVARPRGVLRWLRRAVSAVLLWRRLRRRLGARASR